MAFSYANPTSGPSAGGIGWFTFGTLTISPGTTLNNLTGTLQDGSTVTFDLSLSLTSGQPRTFVAVPTPSFGNAPFGTLGYTGITGNSALYSNFNFNGPGVNTFTISNIVVKDNFGNPISNYTAVLADSETTSANEAWEWQTNGGVWKLLDVLGSNPPIVNGIGTQSVTIAGFQLFPEVTNAAFIMTTQSPTQLIVVSTETISGRQSFNLGFALTKLTLQKDVGQRIDNSDQFVLDIGGTPSDQAITTGLNNGIQNEIATIYPIIDNTYTIDESIALGSASTLTDYYQIISASNATPAGSIPPVSALPITFTPQLGDDVTYKIINAAPEVFTKTVNKAFADIGDILTYTLQVENPNNFALSNVQVTDTTPGGTVYIGNLVVDTAYTGTDINSGIILTTINANTTVTITWQVQVNMFPPIPNPVPNYANVIVPNGTSGMSNIVTTQVNTAFVSIIKSVDKAYAEPGDILTYTLTFNNSGNVSANNVIITDLLPIGTSYVANSLTGATGMFPTLFLNNAIAPLGSEIVTFKVIVSDTLPNPNPIVNIANAIYSYTVDPNNPNGVNKSAQSNPVETLINQGNIVITKLVDKAFASVSDVLTYTLQLQNTGNVAVNNVVLHDVLPSGTTYINGSLLGATGTPPTLTLSNPIAPNDTAVVSFKVLIDPSLPNPNPVINQANTDFMYTIDPMVPNGGSGNSISNPVTTQVNVAQVTIEKATNLSYVDINGIITYTLTVTNLGNVAANNIVIQDAIPVGTTFLNGSLFGASGTPPLFALTSPLQPLSTQVITFQVQVQNAIPSLNPLINGASVTYTFTINPNNPNGATGTMTGNQVSTQVNHAKIILTKAVDKIFAKPGDILTYTLTLQNVGNTIAKDITILDNLATDVSYIANSLQGATGTFPSLHLISGLSPNDMVAISFQVKVNGIPSINPIPNTASTSYIYLIDPTSAKQTQGIATSNTVYTEITVADLPIQKGVNKQRSYPNDIITYTISFTNKGTVAANNVVLHDILANGVSYVPNSLQANVAINGIPPTIQLLQSVAPNQTIQIRFQVKVIGIPNPNPILNQASLTYTFVLNPNEPEVPGTNLSNEVCTIVFRNQYTQQISDLIQSVAYEQASLGALANMEGAKIQSLVAKQNITTNELLCLNSSITEMIAALSLLETILLQKQQIVACQIHGSCDTTGNC